MSHKILVAQGGGPTAVINQSLVGVVLEARRFPDVSHVYGALHGVRGIVNDDLVDLGQETVANLGGGRGDAGRGARLDARQAGPQILPGDLQGSESARDRHVLLHRRQRFLRHGAHRRRGGEEIRSRPARHPHPQDDRQRSRRLRPHAGLPVSGALRRAGVRRRRISTTSRCRASMSPW